MAVFILVRHGENEYVKKGRLAGRLPGVNLNPRGHKQAQKVAEFLKDAPVKAVYSSPLERTMETAAPIAEILGLRVQKSNGLLEVDFGESQDKKLKGLSKLKMWKVVQHSPSRARFPKGESFAEAQSRVVAELDRLAGLHRKQELVVCVSHSDLIKLAVAFYTGIPLDCFQKLQISPASLTALHLTTGGSRLINMNYQCSTTWNSF